MLKNIIKIMSVLIALSTISACASHKTDPDDFKNRVKDRFKTDIRSNGIKLFTYKAKLEMPEEGNTELAHQERIKELKKQSRSKSAKRSIYTPDLSDWTEQIELGLSKTLDMTGYCREGFMELSRMIEVGRAEIRGECNEGATDEDRERFSS
ncbi:hypothetical protein EKG38_23460 [Shewanella canadensis]|uniref:Lipoprotein n=1 Tax=Shewanella canadensis TaxID=271096 RepID=A0A3S0J2J1_9GAMM|nr:hypothetical protein [Shewanella canadensis]RTR36576.1 hypothetical protein EKG38_23460 [Shewanella canadensis]